MTETHFCYWLQGIFELLKPKSLSHEQVICIKQHLDLVTSKKGKFCNWLEGFFEVKGIDAWKSTDLEKIQNSLSLEFLQVIDPSYPKEIQNALYELHTTGKTTFTEKPKPRLEALC